MPLLRGLLGGLLRNQYISLGRNFLLPLFFESYNPRMLFCHKKTKGPSQPRKRCWYKLDVSSKLKLSPTRRSLTSSFQHLLDWAWHSDRCYQNKYHRGLRVRRNHRYCARVQPVVQRLIRLFCHQAWSLNDSKITPLWLSEALLDSFLYKINKFVFFHQ